MVDTPCTGLAEGRGSGGNLLYCFVLAVFPMAAVSVEANECNDFFDCFELVDITDELLDSFRIGSARRFLAMALGLHRKRRLTRPSFITTGGPATYSSSKREVSTP